MVSKQRVVTALVLAAVALAVVLWLPPPLTAVTFAILALAGAWGGSAFFRSNSRPLRVIYVAIAAVLIAIAWVGTRDPAAFTSLLIATALWWVVAFAWIIWFSTRVSRTAAALAGLLVLVPAWTALVRLHMYT